MENHNFQQGNEVLYILPFALQNQLLSKQICCFRIHYLLILLF